MFGCGNGGLVVLACVMPAHAPDLNEPGVCYSFRTLRDLVCGQEAPCAGMGALRAVGGGSKSRVWMQLFADVLGQDITVMLDAENAGSWVGFVGSCRSGRCVASRGLDVARRRERGEGGSGGGGSEKWRERGGEGETSSREGLQRAPRCATQRVAHREPLQVQEAPRCSPGEVWGGMST